MTGTYCKPFVVTAAVEQFTRLQVTPGVSRCRCNCGVSCTCLLFCTVSRRIAYCTRTHLLWPNGWMDEDATWTWYGSKPQPRRHCVRRGPSSPHPRKGHSSGAAHAFFSAHVYCGHARPSQLLLSSCEFHIYLHGANLRKL